jgi:hypothetical protein
MLRHLAVLVYVRLALARRRDIKLLSNLRQFSGLIGNGVLTILGRSRRGMRPRRSHAAHEQRQAGKHHPSPEIITKPSPETPKIICRTTK